MAYNNGLMPMGLGPVDCWPNAYVSPGCMGCVSRACGRLACRPSMGLWPVGLILVDFWPGGLGPVVRWHVDLGPIIWTFPKRPRTYGFESSGSRKDLWTSGLLACVPWVVSSSAHGLR